MRKQVQKERCTKIKPEKCPRVCCLYDKVQLAAARMLNADPSIVQVECNIPLQLNEIPSDDLNLPSETYTTDFVIHFADGKIAVREPADTGSNRALTTGVSSSTRSVYHETK